MSSSPSRPNDPDSNPDLALKPASPDAEARRRPSWWFLLAITVLLALPAGLPTLAHWWPRSDGLRPTGYVYYDYPIYLGKAREHFDPGAFGWTYSQPCSDRYDEPRIYMQPWTVALGAVHHATGLRAGVVYTGFWVVAALFGAATAVALYAEVVGLGGWARRVGLALFFWGGGLLVVGGALLTKLRHQPWRYAELFELDPVQGWWFLNFGRNLVFPTEALYHGLTFLAVWAIIRRRFVVATLVALVTAACSPFAGAGLLATLWVWGAVETIFLRNRERVAGFFVAVNLLLVGFVGYYLGFLNRFEEHRRVARQMEFVIPYNAQSFVPALILVATLAGWTLRDSEHAARYLAAIRGRLLLVWGLVSFGLAQHEFAIPPQQPIHFDRGYPWVALFLLGAPSLVALLERLGRWPRWVGGPALAALVLVFVSDNVAWFAQFPLRAITQRHGAYDLGFLLNADQADVLRALDDRRYYGDLVLSDDRDLSHLVIAETPLRSWYSHVVETLDYDHRRAEVADLFRAGTVLDAWKGRSLLVIARIEAGSSPAATPAPTWVVERGGSVVHQNRSYKVYRVPPLEPQREAGGGEVGQIGEPIR